MNETSKEHGKLIYFLNAYLALYDCRVTDSRWRSEQSLEDQSDAMGWNFDWETVVRHVAPEILVVMSSDRRDNNRAPAYVVIPGDGDWIEMSHDNAVRLVEELTKGAIPVVERFSSLINSLRTMITQLPRERVDESMKHLRALERIIRPSL